MRTGGLIAVFALFATSAMGDNASVLARGVTGRWRVTVFAADKPLHAGKVDLSILIQDGRTGEVARDVDVAMEIQNHRTTFQHRANGNRILYSASIVLRASSEMPAEISIRRGGEQSVLRCSLGAVSAEDSIARYALCFAVVPAGLLLGWRAAKRQATKPFTRTGESGANRHVPDRL